MIESLVNTVEQPESQNDLPNKQEGNLLDKSVVESRSQDWSKPWTDYLSDLAKTNMEDGANSPMSELNKMELDEPWSSEKTIVKNAGYDDVKSVMLLETENKQEQPFEKTERNPERFSERNQYVDSERIKEYRDNPENKPLLEGYEKDADVLRRNMETVMGEDAKDIDKTNSRAHHIVGNNEYSGESKAILEKYEIDINSPENGILLPNNESSDLHGTIHEGNHTKAYNDEVTQRLRMANSKEDVLEILDSIKEDLYNGDMALYNNHKSNL